MRAQYCALALLALGDLAPGGATTAFGGVKGPLAPPVRSTRLAVRGGATSSPLMDAAAGGKPLDVLVTGGVGYIGSHTVVELLNAGHNVIIVDNLCNSNEECLVRVKRITGKTVLLYKCDVRDADGLDKIFKAHKIDAVIHFAGLKAVGESVAKPLEYYDCNVNGAVSLLQTMAKNGVKQIVFSSSATVYGDPASVPVDETFPTSATNPYGQTKLMIEHILEDLAKSDPEWQVSVLRYFNPVGAHASGLIGEDPKGIPNNLMPFIQQVAIGVRAELSIFGSDYPTPDGTGVRDYIHVVDLAKGHLAALRKMTAERDGFAVYNLGTGCGYSVLEMQKAYERVSGRPIPYKLVARRAGDIACVYADTTFAAGALGWRAELGLEAMCADSWRWISANPQGYAAAIADAASSSTMAEPEREREPPLQRVGPTKA